MFPELLSSPIPPTLAQINQYWAKHYPHLAAHAEQARAEQHRQQEILDDRRREAEHHKQLIEKAAADKEVEAEQKRLLKLPEEDM